MHAKIILTATALIGGVSLALTQTSHTGQDDGMDHSARGQVPSAVIPILSEPGQGAFAALSEVVRVMEADHDTDWSQVDLTGLWSHLVDMDRLISDTVVVETNLSDGIIAIATGNAETIDTLHRMVPAHAAQLALDDRWTVAVVNTAEGIELRVTSDNPQVVARIKGLGFFGLMASQDHHREHHLTIALGEDAHGH